MGYSSRPTGSFITRIGSFDVVSHPKPTADLAPLTC